MATRVSTLPRASDLQGRDQVDGHSPELGAILRRLPQNLVPGAGAGLGFMGLQSVCSLALGLLGVWVIGR